MLLLSRVGLVVVLIEMTLAQGAGLAAQDTVYTHWPTVQQSAFDSKKKEQLFRQIEVLLAKPVPEQPGRVPAPADGDTPGWKALDEAGRYMGQRDFTTASRRAEQALNTARKLGDHRLEMKALSAIGGISREVFLGSSLKAVPYHEEALRIAQELRDSTYIITQLMALADNYGQAGQNNRFLHYIGQAVTVLNDFDLPGSRMSLGIMFGSFLQTQGEPARAEKIFQSALAIALKTDRFNYAQHIHWQLFWLHLGMGNALKAQTTLNTLRTTVPAIPKEDFYEAYYQLEKLRGNREAAFRYLELTYKSLGEQYTRRSAEQLAGWETRLRTREKELQLEAQQNLLNAQHRERWYLFGLIALVSILLIVSLIAWYIQRQAKRASYRQNRLIKRQATELQHLDELKSRFFANVSHEFRTPLTLMLGPVNNLLKRRDWKGKDRQMLALIQRNGALLLKLVNEILDLSKLETGRIELNPKPVLLLDFFQPLVAQFSSFSDNERVHFQFDYRANKQLCILLDKDKFEKIVHNYLANALKFTPEGGTVALLVEEAGDALLVKVADTGPGIHPDDLPHIFDRFYQSKLPDVSDQGGAGIGLSLCKELALLMDGSVWAESEYGFGSNFYLRMPLEKADPASAQPMPDAPQTPEPGAIPAAEDKDPAAVGHDKAHVLIVEDNADLRRLLQNYLNEKYRISTAANGQEGLATLAAGLRPDIILSDVMMPVMDGIQMTERIKEQDALRHIPIIMLTARTDIKVKLKVLRLGVDDYLIKPFDEDELLARMDNLLRFSKARNLADFEDEPTDPYHAEIEDRQPDNPPGVVLSTDDAHWLQTVEEMTCEHLLHSNFNAEFLASRLSLSTRQFQRRIRHCTGLSANQYIQEARLQQARELLEGGKVLVKQAAAQVGFKDVKYFTGLYKTRFGKSPSDS